MDIFGEVGNCACGQSKQEANIKELARVALSSRAYLSLLVLSLWESQGARDMGVLFVTRP